jgi:hypothetical protein
MKMLFHSNQQISLTVYPAESHTTPKSNKTTSQKKRKRESFIFLLKKNSMYGLVKNQI